MSRHPNRADELPDDMLRTRSLRTLLAAATAALAAANGAAAALSLTSDAQPSIEVTLDGTDQTGAYTLPMTVEDTNATGEGWNVSVTSTQFSTGGAEARLLSAEASTLTDATSSCVDPGTCVDPANAITYPFTLPAGGTPPTAVKLHNAAAGTGEGIFTLTASIGVAIPANAYAGVYASTVSLTIAAGP